MSELPASLIALVTFIRQWYGTSDFIPLHAPRFAGHEKQYLNDCIDTTFVSSVGVYVDRFEAMMRELTGARYAIATVNGTAALHVALRLAGVGQDDEVITQPLTFVATCNAIAYQGAHPVFVDVERQSLWLCPSAVAAYLELHGDRRPDGVFNRRTGRRIAALLPMHSFGLPADIEGLQRIASEWGIPLVEDAAESLGSYVQGRHTGTFGLLGTFSFNGNKIATCGGGGCIVTDDERLGKLAKHLTTTAKQPHAWHFVHDEVAFNYRMPNINAALGCAQLELLPAMLADKRATAAAYKEFCAEHGLTFCAERSGTSANYWLNTLLLESESQLEAFLRYANEQGVMSRPAWRLMSDLPAFKVSERGPLPNAEWLAARIVNLPSGVRDSFANGSGLSHA